MSNLDQSKDNRFKFNVPLEILKSDDRGWKVRGIASTEDKDLQGEIVKQNGLDITTLKSGRGLFNYEHRNDPENIVGLIEDADITNNGLSVEGYLFKKHKRAQAIAEIIQSLPKDHTKRVQLSIEGKITERDDENRKKINKAMVDRVAITFEPVNQKTYLQFAKSLLASQDNGSPEASEAVVSTPDPKEILTEPSLEENLTEAKEEIGKTLTAAGGEAAPAERAGGAALQPESVDSTVHNLKDDNKKPTKKKKVTPTIKDKKILVKKALASAVKKFPNIPPKVLFKAIITTISDHFVNHDLEDMVSAGEIREFDGLPYIKEPNGVWAPLGHNGL